MGRLLTTLLFICVAAIAQVDRGTITGTVLDPSGAAVPGAQVTATQQGTNTQFRTVTSDTGDFTIPSVPVGAYSVRTGRASRRPSARA